MVELSVFQESIDNAVDWTYLSCTELYPENKRKL